MTMFNIKKLYFLPTELIYASVCTSEKTAMTEEWLSFKPRRWVFTGES